MNADGARTGGSAARRWPARETALIAVACLLLAFAFLGTRGIWDPDEGRYTNVALNMLDSGDWINPMRNEDTGHWTKPPVTYWLVAGSVAAFGHSPWGARLPIAFSYLACMLFAALCARRLVPGGARLAAIVYATMLMPFVAGQLVTTDFPLAAFQALAMYAFVEGRFGPARRQVPWLLLMWAALAAGFMTKGPPALVPLLVVVAMNLLAPGTRVRWPWHLLGVALFAGLALPWYLIVVQRHPGLLQYFLGAELVDRVASDRFGRNGEWYGWIKVYVPALLLGTLPWSADLWRWTRRLPARIGRWRDQAVRHGQAPALLIALWIVLPILVFCLARSRLPLYLLPTFVPLAVAVAAQRLAGGKGIPRWRWLALWVLVLLGLRVAASHMPSHKDASGWAEAIGARAQGPVREVVFVEDMARYGLHLHLDAEIEKLSLLPDPGQSRFNPDFDEPLMQELAEVEREPGIVFVTKSAQWPEVAGAIGAHGYATKVLGTPYYDRIIFEVVPQRRSGTSPARE